MNKPCVHLEEESPLVPVVKGVSLLCTPVSKKCSERFAFSFPFRPLQPAIRQRFRPVLLHIRVASVVLRLRAKLFFF